MKKTKKLQSLNIEKTISLTWIVFAIGVLLGYIIGIIIIILKVIEYVKT